MFPKPLKATPEQFAKTVGKLGKVVLAAANSNVRDRKPQRAAGRPAPSPPSPGTGAIWRCPPRWAALMR
jgi:hypothetical protein